MIRQKEQEILEILKSQTKVASTQLSSNSIGDQAQLLGAGCPNSETSLCMSNH